MIYLEKKPTTTTITNFNNIERFSNIIGMFLITYFSPRQLQMTFLMGSCLMIVGARRRGKGKRERLET